MNEKLIQIGKNAKQAAYKLSLLDTITKNQILNQFAEKLVANTDQILAANQKDIDNASDMPAKFTDRLKLTDQRIKDMAAGLQQVAALQDPIGNIDKAGKMMLVYWSKRNGCHLASLPWFLKPGQM